MAPSALPSAAHWPFDQWPEHGEGIEMDFRLVYDGRLPAAGRTETRNTDKDRIRRELSRQLKELFHTHPSLKGFVKDKHTVESMKNRELNERARAAMLPGEVYSAADLLSWKYERCGQRYVPLISEPYGIACSLDILFLRRDYPGNLIVSGGDIDNRIKVLFDALRLPQNCDEVLATPDGQHEEQVFVLLEDDKLIVDVKITTDRLLTPRADGEHLNDVRLIVHVKTIIVDASKMSALLFG